MSKELTKLAIVGLMATFCMSAAPAAMGGKEIAMSKCSKDSSKCSSKGKDHSCGSDDGTCSGEEDSSCFCPPSDPSLQLKAKREKAAETLAQAD